MGMEMVLARAEILNNDITRQTGEIAGTNYNASIVAFKQIIPHLNKNAEQREKVFKFLKMDESKEWGDGIL
eukprot:1829530-Ditylum_brightwellii.AAC.1